MNAESPFTRSPSSTPSFGVFCNTGSAVNAEICVSGGADWVMVDLEHGAGSEANLLSTLWAIRAAGGYSLVRVESAASSRIARVLDLGADAIMIPSVNSADEARSIVAAANWPPYGSRGVSLQSRAGRYGEVRHTDVADERNRPYIVVQIETAQGLEDLQEIAAVEGLGALFLGPTDLTHDLRIPGELQHPEFERALEAVAGAAAEAGIDAGILATNRQSAERFVEAGYTLVAVGSDASYLRSGIENTMRHLTSSESSKV